MHIFSESTFFGNACSHRVFLWLVAILKGELCWRSTTNPIDLLKLVNKELILTFDTTLVYANGESTNYWIQRKVGTLKFQT